MIERLSRQAARWLPKDQLLKRLMRNVGIVVSGQAGASALALLSIALTARTLGAEALGILVMMEAYVRLIDQWIRPETWQVLIKYGADALSSNDSERFKQLIKFGFVVDLSGALAALLIAWFGIHSAAHWLGWHPETADLAFVYCFILLGQITSTPTAVLRLFNRFSVFAYAQIVAASIRLLMVVVAWWLDAGLDTFVVIAMITAVAQPAIMLTAATTELRKRGFSGFLTTPLAGVIRRYPRILAFIISTNLSLLLRKTVENTDVLIVGALLGPASSGGLHIVKRVSQSLIKLGGPVQQVLYPDITKLWAKNEMAKFRQALRWSNLAGGSLGLFMLVFIGLDPALVMYLLGGEEFTQWSTLLLWQILATTIFMFGLGLRPALYSMERDIALLRAVVLATIMFYVVFLGSIMWIGVSAASIGHCVFNAVWLVLAMSSVHRAISEKRLIDL